MVCAPAQVHTPTGWSNRNNAVELCEQHLRNFFAKLGEAATELAYAREALIGYTHVEEHSAACDLLNSFVSRGHYEMRGTVNRLIPTRLGDTASLAQAKQPHI